MKLVKEHINFERGLDPREAMGVGDEEARLKAKYFPMFKEVFEPLLKKYSLRPKTYEESVIYRSITDHQKITHIEATCKARGTRYAKNGYEYFLGYNREIDKYYCGYAVDIDSENPIEQEIDPYFLFITQWLTRYVDKNEALK